LNFIFYGISCEKYRKEFKRIISKLNFILFMMKNKTNPNLIIANTTFGMKSMSTAKEVSVAV